MVAVLEFLPEVEVVLSRCSVLQVVVEAAVLVHGRHRLHDHRPVAALPAALQSRLPRLERPGGLNSSVPPPDWAEFLTFNLSF